MATGTLTESLEETLSLFEECGVPRTTTEVAEFLDLGRRSTYDRLERLVDQGRLETKKVGANARVWWRPQSPAIEDDLEQSPAASSLVDDVLEGVDVGIFVLDENFDVAWLNETVETYFGLEHDAVLGEDKRSLVDETIASRVEDGEAFAATLCETYDDNTFTERFECRVTPDADRESRWLEHRSRPIQSGAYAGGRVELYYDVTNRKSSERERQREREKLEAETQRERELVSRILESSPVGIQVLDGNGTVVRMNDRAQELLGVAGEQTPSSADADRTVEADAYTDAVTEPYARALETGDPVYGWQAKVEEATVEAEDGARWLSVNAVPVEDVHGDVERVVVTTQDVTQRKSQAASLQRQRDELEAELADVFERISDGFYGLNIDFEFTFTNDRAEELLGVDEESVVGRHVRDVLDLTVEFEAAIERALESQEPTSFEEYYAPAGSWFENTIYPSETGVSVYFRDVTDRKRRERELERYQTIFETIEDGVYVVDEAGTHTQMNEAYASMMGYDREELIGANVADVIHDESVLREAKLLEEELVSTDRSTASLEAELERPDGERWVGEVTMALMGTIDGYERVGVVRDVTARRERERDLRDRVHQQEVVTELGRRALEYHDLDDLMAEATELVAATLGNDYSMVMELDAAAEELRARQGVGWKDGVVGTTTVSAEADASEPAYTLRADEPVVVSDLAADSRFDGPSLLTSHDVRSGVSTVIGPSSDPWGILGTYDASEKSFSAQDANFVQSVANILASAIERHGHEADLRRQRRQLGALNNLNEVARDITSAVIEQSTREEIERTVCERLADTDSYVFAWIGDVDTASQTVRVRAEAGVDGYLDDVTISVDAADERSQGPTGRALLEKEVQVSQLIAENATHDPWREHVEAYGVESSAAIPIAHENTTYGVLNVYSDRPHAFENDERAVVAQLGEIVGHAIAATERKRALMSDELVELDFHIPDVFDALDVVVETDSRITFDDVVPIDDTEFLAYGTAEYEAVETLSALVEAVQSWKAITYYEVDDGVRFQLRLVDPPVISAVAARGGYVDEAAFEDGDYRMRVHLSPSVDVREVIETVESTYPAAEMLRRMQVERDRDDPRLVRRRLADDLTDRQRATLEAAYHSGFFEWPRDTSGEDVAATLGVAPPTFHQHLRKAEKKVLDSLLSSLSAEEG